MPAMHPSTAPSGPAPAPRTVAPTDLRATLLQALTEIAPELDPSSLDPGAPLRDQVDLDSADWLDFLTAIEQRLNVIVAETDATRLRTLDQIVAHCTRT
jgi:acyl carrier protein